MTKSFKVHYIIGDDHIDSDDAISAEGAALADLVRSMRSEDDIVYCYPEWCSGERVVFWGHDADRFFLEFQKSREAMLYSREFAVRDIARVIDGLQDLWDEPLASGFSVEQY